MEKIEFSMVVYNLVIIVEKFISVLRYVSLTAEKITHMFCLGLVWMHPDPPQSTWVERNWDGKLMDLRFEVHPNKALLDL